MDKQPRSKRPRANLAAWANGTIVESRSALGCGRSRTAYYAIARCTYQVGGIGREGRRVRFGAANCYSMNQAKALVDQFPVASVTTVRFVPEAPARSVLIAGSVDESTTEGIYFLSFWLLLAAGATGMVVTVERSRRRPSPGLPPQRELGGS